MNEYREQILGLLGKNFPFEVLKGTPERVASLVERMGEEELGRRYGPGKWTGREVVGHLADVEIGQPAGSRDPAVRSGCLGAALLATRRAGRGPGPHGSARLEPLLLPHPRARRSRLRGDAPRARRGERRDDHPHARGTRPKPSRAARADPRTGRLAAVISRGLERGQPCASCIGIIREPPLVDQCFLRRGRSLENGRLREIRTGGRPAPDMPGSRGHGSRASGSRPLPAR